MLLVTNDYPPKVGGIQNYLYELWSRQPYDNSKVITTKYKGAREFDAAQNHHIERFSKILWPTPKLISKVNETIKELNTEVVFIDPMLPTALIAPKIKGAKTVLIIHGAEITVPARLPISKSLVKYVANNVDHIISAGTYAANELVKSTSNEISMLRIPPGVDTNLYSKPSNKEKIEAKVALKEKLAIPLESKILMSASRVVPRKGFDYAIKTLSQLDKDTHLVIVGVGRDLKRLKKIAESLNLNNRVHFLGRVSQEDLIATYHGSDLFLMLCRDRWKSLEAEGFGIVFLEAQSCGLPVIVGESGGSNESLIDTETGFLVNPTSISQIKSAINSVLKDDELQEKMSLKARDFVVNYHSYDYLASLMTPLGWGDFTTLQKFR